MSKLIKIAVPAALIVSLCCTVPGWAVNSVVIESMPVAPGETSVTVGVYIENDVSISAIILPLEFRQLTAGAYVTNSLTLTVQGRVATSGLMDFVTLNYHPTPDANTCSGPISQTFGVSGSIDFVSPDGIFWSGLNFINPALAPGSDGSPPTGTPSFLLTFDVTNTDGIFEIDTCCMAPANHLVFVDAVIFSEITPSFTKGVITIGSGSCCAVPGDANHDGGADISDLTYAISFVYLGRDPLVCTEEFDSNSDGVIDIIDVVWFINYMFNTGPPPVDCQSHK